MQAITDLQNRLDGPEAPALRKQLRERLTGCEARLQEAVRAGSAPEQFSLANALTQALQAAQRVLARAERNHASTSSKEK